MNQDHLNEQMFRMMLSLLHSIQELIHSTFLTFLRMFKREVDKQHVITEVKRTQQWRVND